MIERTRRGPAAGEIIRREQLDWALQTLQSGASVLLSGEAGSGKTFLKNAIGQALPRPEFAVVRVSASVGRSRLPWSALGVSLGLTDLHTKNADEVEAVLAERLGEARSESSASIVLLVDDARLLDRESMEWIGGAARRSSAVVLAAVDRTPTDLGATRSETEGILRALWIDGIAERLDLARLDERASLRLAAEFGADVLDNATLRYLVHQASGIPLLIRELVLDGVESATADSLVPTAVSLATDDHCRYPQLAVTAAPFVTPGPRAFDLSRMRVSGLTAHQQESLVLLERLGTIPQQRAAHLTGADTLTELMRRGHVVVDPAAPGYIYALASDADFASAILGRLWSGPLTGHALDTILDGHAAGLQMSPVEAVFVVVQWDDPGAGSCAVARERFGDEFVASIHVLAAAQANVSGHPNEALTFARRADRLSRTTSASIETARALASLGQRAAARTVLRNSHATAVSYDCRLAWLRAVTSLIRFDRSDDARELLGLSADWHPHDPSFAGERVLAGVTPLDTGNSPLQRLLQIVADERVDVLTRLRACGDVGMFAAYQAELDVLTRTLAVAARLAEARPKDAYQLLQLRDVTVGVFCDLSVGQTLLREGMDELAEDIGRRMLASIKHRHYSHVASLGAVIGVLAVARGDYASAERELRAAGDRYTGIEPIGWKAWAACEHATVLTAMGRVDEAETRLAAVRHDGDPEASWYAYSFRTAGMALRRARGQLGEARQAALELAGQHPLSPVVQVQQYFAAAVSGEPDETVTAAAVRVARKSALPSLIAMADFLTAAQQADAAQALAVAERLRDLGLAEAAKAAFDYASGRAAQLGDGRRERSAARAAAALGATIRGTPSAAAGGIDFDVLTVREREIVRLIADGRGNREISERLFLSIRTVESHVYRALRKLSLTTRRDLMPGGAD